MTITAEPRATPLAGTYAARDRGGLAEVPFAASRTAPALPPAPKAGKSSPGRGASRSETAPGKVDRLTGVFAQKGAALTGTLLSITGDYGGLHGWFDGERMVLTVFDGVHVYRYDGELLPDGTLAGEYRSRTSPPVPWRASASTRRPRPRSFRGASRSCARRTPPRRTPSRSPTPTGRPFPRRRRASRASRWSSRSWARGVRTARTRRLLLRDLKPRYGPKGVGFVGARLRVHRRRGAQPAAGEALHRAIRGDVSRPHRGDDAHGARDRGASRRWRASRATRRRSSSTAPTGS